MAIFLLGILAGAPASFAQMPDWAKDLDRQMRDLDRDLGQQGRDLDRMGRNLGDQGDQLELRGNQLSIQAEARTREFMKGIPWQPSAPSSSGAPCWHRELHQPGVNIVENSCGFRPAD